MTFWSRWAALILYYIRWQSVSAGLKGGKWKERIQFLLVAQFNLRDYAVLWLKHVCCLWMACLVKTVRISAFLNIQKDIVCVCAEIESRQTGDLWSQRWNTNSNIFLLGKLCTNTHGFRIRNEKTAFSSWQCSFLCYQSCWVGLILIWTSIFQHLCLFKSYILTIPNPASPC